MKGHHYSVGDRVKWGSKTWDTAKMRRNHGDGPFVIATVKDAEETPHRDLQQSIAVASIGQIDFELGPSAPPPHPQLLKLEGVEGQFTAAWFEPADISS